MALDIDPRGGVFENTPLDMSADVVVLRNPRSNSAVDDEISRICRDSKLVQRHRESLISAATVAPLKVMAFTYRYLRSLSPSIRVPRPMSHSLCAFRASDRRLWRSNSILAGACSRTVRRR